MTLIDVDSVIKNNKATLEAVDTVSVESTDANGEKLHNNQQQQINNNSGEEATETLPTKGAFKRQHGGGRHVDRRHSDDMEATTINVLSDGHNESRAPTATKTKSSLAAMILQSKHLETKENGNVNSNNKKVADQIQKASKITSGKLASEQQQQHNNQPVEEKKSPKAISESGHPSHQKVVDLIKQQNDHQARALNIQAKPILAPATTTTARPLTRLQLQLLDHKSIASSSSVLAGDSYVDRLAGASLLVGLPLVTFALFAMIVCMFFKVCRAGLGGDSSGKANRSSGSAKSKSRAGDSAFKKSPIGFISGGKVIDNLQGIQVLAGSHETKARAALKRQSKLDRRQLTLDMDDNYSDEHLGVIGNGVNKFIPSTPEGEVNHLEQQKFQQQQPPHTRQHTPALQKSPSLFSKATIKSIGRKASVGSTSSSTSSGFAGHTKMSFAKRGKSFARSIIMMSRQETMGQKSSSCDRINGMNSISQIDEQPQQKYGRLKFKLDYDFSASIFHVTIIEAEDLAAMDLNGYSDPYVTLSLTPDPQKMYQKEKTKIRSKTLNPKFNETFKFPVAYSDLTRMTLTLVCYDYDRFSKHDEIGQVSIPIESVDLAQATEEWRNLRRPKDEANKGQLGDICLSLRYVPTAGKLTVIVQEARKLKKMDLAGLSDPYVKLALMINGKRTKKKKTSIKKCTLNPHYNESFSFEVPFEQVQKVQLVITVVDYDRIGTSEPIGKIVLGCEQTTGETEMNHWMDMLASPRRPISRWHTLTHVDGLDGSGKGDDDQDGDDLTTGAQTPESLRKFDN